MPGPRPDIPIHAKLPAFDGPLLMGNKQLPQRNRMNIEQLIQPESVLCNADARSKKHCLEILSELLARANPDIGSEEIFSKLIERERLGCTGLDKGIAFPHCRIAGVANSSGALIKLVQPVDFDSPDAEFVDLVFGLMVPEELDDSHYRDIEQITGLLNDEKLRARLRQATTSKALYDTLFDGHGQAAPKLRSARNA
jgi:PTS system nitrogen regulatory IIA component